MPTGDQIKKRMKKLGISQNRLAKMAGISQSGLSSIVNGAVSAKEDTLQRIAHVLGCTPAELMGENVPEEGFSVEELSMIRIYRKLSAKGKEYIRQQFDIAAQLYMGESAAVSDMAN